MANYGLQFVSASSQHVDVPNVTTVSTDNNWVCEFEYIGTQNSKAPIFGTDASNHISVWNDNARIVLLTGGLATSLYFDSTIDQTQTNKIKITSDGATLTLYLNDVAQVGTVSANRRFTSFSYLARSDVYLNGQLNFATVTINSDTSKSRSYLLDEGSGTVTADTSGNGQDGTLVNSPTWILVDAGGGTPIDVYPLQVTGTDSVISGITLTKDLSIGSTVSSTDSVIGSLVGGGSVNLSQASDSSNTISPIALTKDLSIGSFVTNTENVNPIKLTRDVILTTVEETDSIISALTLTKDITLGSPYEINQTFGFGVSNSTAGIKMNIGILTGIYL